MVGTSSVPGWGLKETPPTVPHITREISQVFSNLISNALAFRPVKNGVIEIGTLDNSDCVTFFVLDNGIGISEEQQKNIFKKFYQVDTSSKRKKEGSGLGLSICEGIVRNLGGRMWVESVINQGTTFFFDLPKAKIPIENLKSLKNSKNQKNDYRDARLEF